MKILLTVVCFSLLAWPVFAQSAGEITTNTISVALWVPPADHNLHAPATIHLVANVSTHLPGHPGDTLKVNFLANSKYVGSATCTWHAERRPDPNSRSVQPMIIVPAGFSAAEWVWKKVPAGTYSVTATVIGGNGLSAFSPPEQVTVLP